MDIVKMAAGILAGGRHTRMGEDKLLLCYEGKSFLEHIYEECGIFPERKVSVANKEQYGQFPYDFVEDEIQGSGPLEGIYQLLLASRSDFVFVLAADMPRVTSGFLRTMADRFEGEDCLVLSTKDGIHPLCAVYSKSVFPLLKQMREEGIRKPRLLYEKCSVRYVSAEELGYPDAIVQNINTPEEYKKLITEAD